jgi:hypothetical protein
MGNTETLATLDTLQYIGRRHIQKRQRNTDHPHNI